MATNGQNWWDMTPEARNDYLFRQRGFDPQGNNELGTMYQQYAAALYPQVASGINFMGELQPRRQQAIRGLLNDLGPTGMNSGMTAYASGADENAAQAARQSALAAHSSGLGDGFAAGQQAGAYNQAAAQKNAYRAQVQSPEARVQRAAAILQAIEQGSYNPALQMQMGFFGPIEQRHQQNNAEMGSGSFLQPFLNAVSTAHNMGWNPFLRSMNEKPVPVPKANTTSNSNPGSGG